MPAHDHESLRAFRTALHACFERRADALFELGDALLAADPAGSLPHLSLQASHRRGWGSVYAGLAAGHLDVAALRTLLARHATPEDQPVYAIDLSDCAVPSGLAASPPALLDAASTLASDSGDTAGWSSARFPGCSAFAALASATSGAPTCSTSCGAWTVR